MDDNGDSTDSGVSRGRWAVSPYRDESGLSSWSSGLEDPMLDRAVNQPPVPNPEIPAELAPSEEQESDQQQGDQSPVILSEDEQENSLNVLVNPPPALTNPEILSGEERKSDQQQSPDILSGEERENSLNVLVNPPPALTNPEILSGEERESDQEQRAVPLVPYSESSSNKEASDPPLNLYVSTGPESAAEELSGKSHGEQETERRGRSRKRREPFVLTTSEDESLPSPPPTKKPVRAPKPKSTCPRCGKQVINLKRHYRQVHQRRTATTLKSPSGYVIRICPLPACGRRLARLRRHLLRVHKIRDVQRVEMLMKSSTVCMDEPERPLSPCERRSPPPSPPPSSASSSSDSSPPIQIISEPEDHEEDTTIEVAAPADDVVCVDLSQEEETSAPQASVAPRFTRFNHMPILREFTGWMQMPDIDKDESQACAHARQVFSILQAASPDFQIKDLLDTDRIKERWLADFLKTWQPGTARAYLSSLVYFYEFLLHRRKLPNRSELTGAIAMIKRQSRSLRKRVLIRRSDKEQQDLEEMISPGEVSSFLASTQVQEIERKLDDPNFRLTDASEYSIIRNYIMLRILLANGQRPGVLHALTPATLDKARITPNGAVVTVSRHKTGYVGPATIAFPDTLWKWIQAYLRLLYASPGYIVNTQRKASIFLNFKDGLDERPVELSSSSINYALNTLWKKVHKDKTVSATKLRKSIVTHVRQEEPMAREVLAKHMCHNPATADRYYHLQVQRNIAIPMSNLITSTMTRETDKTPLEDQPSTSGSLPIASRPADFSDEEVVPPSPRKMSSVIPINHGRRSFSEIEVETLMRLSRSLIKKESFSTTEALNVLTSTEEGLTFCLAMQSRLGEGWKKKIQL